MKKTNLALALSLVFIYPAPKTFADEVSLGIYPPIIRIHANPTASVSAPLVLYNNSSNPINASLSLRSFEASDKNDGTISYYSLKDTPKKDSDFLNSVHIQQDSQDIKSINIYPKEYKNIKILFNTPKETGRDYYFSVLLSKPSPQGSSDQTKVYIVPSVASNVLLSVNGETPAKGFISTFTSQPFLFSGPVEFKLSAQNTSSSFSQVQGQITLYDFFGTRTGIIPLKPSIILGKSTRVLTAASQSQNNGNKITWGENFLFGYYKADALIRFNGVKSVSSETHFLAIPTIFLVFVTLALFIVLSVIYRVIKKINFKE